MKYQIGDKVKLKNGCIAIITDIQSSIDGSYCDISYMSPITEDMIIGKIED